ncbi:MAG TPA: DUF192 domain-containing protein [Bacteroidetes bacterium]|nr:DUF192 domain-containing protein [Bacteroidota bacterium]
MTKSSAKKTSSNAPKKRKKKASKRNYRQIIISLLVGLALVAFILPDIMPLFRGGANRGYVPSNNATNTNNAMPEPTFTKEGELTLISGETGEPIKKIDIEKADNDAERAFGMMFRKSSTDNQGMLFLFDNSEPQSFWMKNTLIPLDIIYIDENKKITTIYPNTTPLSETSLPSNGNAKYVLETRGGFCEEYGVKVGDIVDWK